MIESRVEIAATPSRVREIFLDFSKYSEWHSSFIASIETGKADQPSYSLQPGDEVKCDIFDTKFTAVITENSEKLFQWQGPRMYGIAGLHGFHFEPANNGVSTTFIQTETFSGPLAFLMSPYLLGRMVIGRMKGFDSDLKLRAQT